MSEVETDNRGLTGVIRVIRVLTSTPMAGRKGDLIVIAARPSVGKTAFALNLAGQRRPLSG
jgi:replicative DNA helicase